MTELVRGWPYPLTVAALFVVVLLRAGATYGLGRAAEAGARRTRAARLLARPGFDRARRLVLRWGAPLVALSFLTVGFQTLVNAAAGLTRMPLRRYLPALVVGALLWAFLYATVGLATFAAWRRLYQLAPGAALAAGLVLLGLVAGYVVWQRRRPEPDPGPPAPAEG